MNKAMVQRPLFYNPGEKQSLNVTDGFFQLCVTENYVTLDFTTGSFSSFRD